MLPVRTLVAAAALLAVAVTPALSRQYTSTLEGDMGSLTLVAKTSQTESLWTYTYDLTFDTKAPKGGNVHSFSLDNMGMLPYQSAANSGQVNRLFANPTYTAGSTAIEWTGGEMVPGQTITFSYTSAFAPDIVPIWASVGDSGTYASGLTMGMPSSIPEPGSFMALGGMMMCAAGLYGRRKR